jgi:hypothetical protein
MSLVSDLISGLDDLLGIRDDLGAALKNVYIVTRTWTGSEVQDGTYSDAHEQVLPSPRVVEFMNEFVIKEGGAVQQGDILLTGISKESYPTQGLIDCTSIAANQERFYKVGTHLYRVIMVKEKLLTWKVQLRKVTKQ